MTRFCGICLTDVPEPHQHGVVRLVKCSACDGDGAWSDENDEYVCAECHGSGTVSDRGLGLTQAQADRLRKAR